MNGKTRTRVRMLTDKIDIQKTPFAIKKKKNKYLLSINYRKYI